MTSENCRVTGPSDPLPLFVEDSHLKAKAVRDGILAVIGATIFVGGTVIAMTTDYSPILAKIYALCADVVRVLQIGSSG